MADPSDLLPPAPDPGPPPAPRPRRIECGFCDCSLVASGEPIALSAKAKKFRDAADQIERHEVTIARLEKELADLKAATQPARRSESLL